MKNFNTLKKSPFEKLVRKIIHRAICMYLNKFCGGAFHSYPYGKDGRYVVLMSEKQYGNYKERDGE